MTARRALCALAFVPLTARPARAQVADLQLGAGLYQPFTDQARHTDATSGQRSSYRVGTTLALDGRFALWLSSALGVEFAAVRAQPTRTVSAAAVASSSASITLLAVKVVRRVRVGDQLTLRFGAGVARVRLAGTSYDTATVPLETTSGGVTVSASIARSLGPRLSLVLGIDDWIYKLDEKRSAPTLVLSGTTPLRQHDLVVRLGLAAKR